MELNHVENEELQWPPCSRKTRRASWAHCWSVPMAVWALCHLWNLLLQLPTGSPHGPSASARGAAPGSSRAVWLQAEAFPRLCMLQQHGTVVRSPSGAAGLWPQWGEAQAGAGAPGEAGFLRKEGLQFVKVESQLIGGGWLVYCWRTSLTISHADFWAGLSIAAGKHLPACNSKIPSDSTRGPFRCC